MRTFGRVLLTLLMIGGAGGVAWWWRQSRGQETRLAPLAMSPAPAPTPTAPAPPEIRFPVPVSSGASPGAVPAVDESDPSIQEALGRLIGAGRFAALFVPKDIVRRLVVTISNATGPKQPSQEFSPLKPLESDFRVGTTNFRRYAPYAALAQAVDPAKLVALYVHYYSLFQAAYGDLGTKGYFNDRVVAALDNLLAAPEPQDPPKVERPGPRNKYKFAEDRLESLPATQKLLIRMGPENERTIKGKLQTLRALLTHL